MPALASLDAFFAPRSVAVVGASARETSVGYALLENLLFGRMGGRDRAEGFPGPVYAVNPRGGELLGHPVHRALAEIGAPVDLALVATPPATIPGLIREAADAGARGVIVITAGFGELGDEGQALQRKLTEAAEAAGVRLIGPNCLGVLRPGAALNASFAAAPPPPGRIGLLSQSGALVTGLISYAQREAFGLSAAVSLGAKADVDDQDVIAWLADDPQTHAIAVYIEAVRDPRAFFDVVRRVSPLKPIVAIKGGATEAGAKAASSHTGSLAGSARAYEAAFTQAGVLQAPTTQDFAVWARALAHQPPAKGRRIAVVTNAGGPGVLAADALVRAGLELATLSADTLAALDAVLPAVWSRGNPVDVIGDATPERYREAINVIGRAPEVDGVIVIMTVQAMTDPMATAQAIAEAHADPSWSKPLTASFVGLIGTEVGRYLDERGVPELNMPEMAVSAMQALVRRGQWLSRQPAPEVALPRHPAPDHEAARRALAEARAAGQRNLDLERARRVLAAAGVRYNGAGQAADAAEAARVAADIGFPVVIKANSPDIVHKSDVGAVVLNVADAAQVAQACALIRRRVGERQPGARITGFTVEEQVSGTEIIVGMSRDPDFGPLLMVGLGGVFVEVFGDVAFRLLPLGRRDALDMIGEIKAQALFEGARKLPKLDRAELAEVLVRISALVEALPEIGELDLNPLVLTAEGLVAIDARVVLA